MTAVTVYTAEEARLAAKVPRARLDAACQSGALPASDVYPESHRRTWRILASDLEAWIRAGYPAA